jgi:group I intron endonuclease
MIGTGFLGFRYIAQNDLNNTTNNNNNLELQAKLFKVKLSQFVSTKRRYSTYITPRISSSIERTDVVKNFLNEKNLNPVFVYENLKNDIVKRQIVEETKGLSGIYLILNKITLSYYIGSASTGRLKTRFSNHLINFTGSKVVKNAVKKYKLDNFAFIVLELFPVIVDRENNKKLLDLEDFYLKSLLPDYNILTEAGSSFGYKHTEVTRLKMKAEYSEERRAKIGSLNRDKKLSLDTIESIRKAADFFFKKYNRKKVVYSEEGLLNMKKNSRPVLVKEISGIVYAEYPSVTETANAFNCSVKTVQRALKGETKLLKKR